MPGRRLGDELVHGHDRRRSPHSDLVCRTGGHSVEAADRVGNVQTASVRYAVTYAVEPLNDASGSGIIVERGATTELVLRIADAHRTNRSAPSITLTARGLVSADRETRVELDEALRFDP